MRLNGRGLANIWEHEENKGLDIDCYEFQPSDFDDGIVILTLEEAQRVQSALYELLRNSNDKNSREWLAYWMVNGRIEQAKGYIPINVSFMEGKLILPEQAEKQR